MKQQIFSKQMRLGLIAWVVAGIGLGCGQTPLSVEQESSQVVRATKSVSQNTKSGASLAVGVDVGVGYTNSVSGTFKPNKNGKLSVSFPNYGAEVQVRSVEFGVDKGSLDQRTEITMDVTTGLSLDDVSVVFGPAGTTFDPSAALVIKLSGGDPSAVQAHHYSNDQVTAAEIEKVAFDDGSSGWKIVLKVPGFSRYSLGGDR